jgi:hypothetical protein
VESVLGPIHAEQRGCAELYYFDNVYCNAYGIDWLFLGGMVKSAYAMVSVISSAKH